MPIIQPTNLLVVASKTIWSQLSDRPRLTLLWLGEKAGNGRMTFIAVEYAHLRLGRDSRPSRTEPSPVGGEGTLSALLLVEAYGLGS